MGVEVVFLQVLKFLEDSVVFLMDLVAFNINMVLLLGSSIDYVTHFLRFFTPSFPIVTHVTK